MHYQYKYVPLRTGGGFWIDNSSHEHCAIIDRHAADGWRYAGFIPTRFSGEGGMKEIDLIFEKPVEE
ncbi:MAG: DUF4177 domain-containing protein [Butyricicoccus pullicaecorum]|nr:DUF4177 domain-containing protein [Butyricicoccus pullicaecorum]